MAKHLVIVESPAKAKTINKILGKDYIVKASLGHVRDLPTKKLGVDVDNNFKPEYVKSKGKEKVIKELRAEAKKVEDVMLAPDPDREGEAIAWHLQEVLKDVIPEENFYRVTYNQITAPAIKEAFSNPTQLDTNKVDAQQARRVIDRIVGYQVSPLLWRRIRGGSSAGRVQTVALRLVCERERLILDFKPEKFWILGATVAKQVDPKDPFAVKLLKIDGEKAVVDSQELADDIRAELDKRTLTVDKIASREKSKKAAAPFITSTLQQAASSHFGFTPKRTMGIAQKLYEGVKDSGGLITYMRTDSFHLAPEAIAEIRTFVEAAHGNEFIPEKPNIYKSKGSAQEAHEAIRVTDVNRTPEHVSAMLSPEEAKLYDLIWRRTVSSQMAPSRRREHTIDIDAAGGEGRKYTFRASASELLFAGYTKVWKLKEKGDDEDNSLPPLSEGEKLDTIDWLSEEKETQPPPRFSEASLIRELESNGVGRPSTYAATISTITDREYVEKEKRNLKPTELGFKVNDYLVGSLSDLFNVNFTANMEAELDKIEDGELEWGGMLAKFYADFEGWVLAARGKSADRPTVQRLVNLLDKVVEWAPPVKRGKRTYSDEKFWNEMREAVKDEEKTISEAQFDALKRMVCRYRTTVEGFGDELVAELELKEALEIESRPKLPPREHTLAKMDLFKDIKFDEAKKIGKRTYDDKKFVQSLRDQVEGGKRLSDKQLAFLEKLMLKYSEQIPDFEKVRDEFGMEEPEEDLISGGLLELMGAATEWKPPVQRGKRTWDDREFFDSLSGQFKTKKALSPRQQATLKKMIIRYAHEIPGYRDAMEAMDLPEPKEKKAPAEKKKPAAKKKAAAKKKPAAKKKTAAKKKAPAKKAKEVAEEGA